MKFYRQITGTCLSLLLYSRCTAGHLRLLVHSSSSLPPTSTPSLEPPVLNSPTSVLDGAHLSASLASNLAAKGSVWPSLEDHSTTTGLTLKVPRAASTEPVRGPVQNMTVHGNGTVGNITQSVVTGTIKPSLPSSAPYTFLRSPNFHPKKPNAPILTGASVNPTNAAFREPSQNSAAGSPPPTLSRFIRATGGITIPTPGIVQAAGGLKVDALLQNATKIPLNTTPPDPLVTMPPLARFDLAPDLNLTGVKAMKVSNPSWSTNTSITTVSPGGTQPTVVPVVVAAAGVGLVIFGLSELETPLALGEIAEAAELAEEEPIGEEEEEEDEDEEDQQKSETQTSISQTSITTSLSSSSTFSSESFTTTGEPSTATSSTSSPSSSSASTSSYSNAVCSKPTDLPHLGDPDDYDGDDQYQNSKARARRFVSGGASVSKRQLQKQDGYRQTKKPVTSLGACKLDEATLMPVYWKANSLMGKKGNGQTWYMPVLEDPENIVAPTYTTVATPALRTMAPGKKNVLIGGKSGYRVNVDHVYEVSILKRFFEYNLWDRKVCQNFNGELMQIGSQSKATRLATIFRQLPGAEFGGLVGMAERLNSIKAYLFNPGSIQHGLFTTNLCDAMDNLNSVGMVMDMLHNNEIRGFFNDANARIYQALLGADQAAAAEQCSANGFSWAAEYKSWIASFLAQQEAEIGGWAWATQSAIAKEVNSKSPTSTLDDPQDYDRQRLVAYLNSPYAKPSHWRFNFNLQFPKNSIPMVRRDAGAACTKIGTATTVPSASHTASPVATQDAQSQAGPSPISAQTQPQTPPAPAAAPAQPAEFISSKGYTPVSANQLNNELAANAPGNSVQDMSAPDTPSASPIKYDNTANKANANLPSDVDPVPPSD